MQGDDWHTPGHCGPVRWACRVRPPAPPAQALAVDWLAEQLGCPAPAIIVVRDQWGRPRIGGGHDASWSHGGELLAVALATGAEVGIDIEPLRAHRRALDIARRFFTAAEAEWLAAQPDAARGAAFVRLWCGKEAVLKAHGRGLAFGLHRLAFAEVDGALTLVAADPALGAPADWTLHEFRPAPGYRGAVAWRRPPPAP